MAYYAAVPSSSFPRPANFLDMFRVIDSEERAERTINRNNSAVRPTHVLQRCHPAKLVENVRNSAFKLFAVSRLAL